MLSTVIFEFFGVILSSEKKQLPVSGTKELIEELIQQSIPIYFYLPTALTYPLPSLLKKLEGFGYSTEVLNKIQWATSTEMLATILTCNTINPPLLVVASDFYRNTANQTLQVPTFSYLNDEYSNVNNSGVSCLLESMSTIDYTSLEEEYLRAMKLPVTIATTSRLELRELTTDEIVQVFDLYSDIAHCRFIDSLGSLQEEIAKHKAYIKTIYQFYRLGLYGIFLKGTNQLIGRCGLQPVTIDSDENEIELAYHIHPDYLHHGYAYESILATLHYAKNYHSFESVVAIIHPQNISSCNLAKKIGMFFEREISYKSEIYQLYRINLI